MTVLVKVVYKCKYDQKLNGEDWQLGYVDPILRSSTDKHVCPL